MTYCYVLSLFMGFDDLISMYSYWFRWLFSRFFCIFNIYFKLPQVNGYILELLAVNCNDLSAGRTFKSLNFEKEGSKLLTYCVTIVSYISLPTICGHK